MISRGYLCFNTLLCASIVYESLTFEYSGFLRNGIKYVQNIQPDKNRFKLKNHSSISIMDPSNKWLTNIITQKERIKKNKMDPVNFRDIINSGKNKDKVINTIREMRNDTKPRTKKDKWHKEVEMYNENYEDNIIIGQHSGEKWQEKHDDITDLQHIRNSIERHGRKDVIDNMLSSIALDTRVDDYQNQKDYLNDWRESYENIKLNKTSEEEQMRIIAQNRRKEKLESEMKLLDNWSESHGKISKPEYKIRTVMRKMKNKVDKNRQQWGDRKGHIGKANNNVIIDDLLLIWDKANEIKSREKLKVDTSRKNTSIEPDYLDPSVGIGPMTMWHRRGKKRYENIMFNQYSPLRLWKVKEKNRENIDRLKDYSFNGVNNLMNSLNLISMWSERDKRRKSLRDSKIMNFIDRWDYKQHTIGSIL